MQETKFSVILQVLEKLTKKSIFKKTRKLKNKNFYFEDFKNKK